MSSITRSDLATIIKALERHADRLTSDERGVLARLRDVINGVRRAPPSNPPISNPGHDPQVRRLEIPWHAMEQTLRDANQANAAGRELTFLLPHRGVILQFPVQRAHPFITELREFLTKKGYPGMV